MKRASGLVLTVLLATASSGAPAPSPAAQQLFDLESSWMTAIVARDGKFLADLYADDYLYTGPDGSVSDKPTDIAEIVSGATQIESSKRTRMKVIFYDNVAVVSGVNAIRGKRDDKSINGRYRFTDAFVQHEGGWRIVAAHETLISS